MSTALQILIWLGIITLGLPIIIGIIAIVCILIDSTTEYHKLKKRRNEIG